MERISELMVIRTFHGSSLSALLHARVDFMADRNKHEEICAWALAVTKE
jgi:hypothetical protein